MVQVLGLLRNVSKACSASLNQSHIDCTMSLLLRAIVRYCEQWYMGVLLFKDLVTEGTVGHVHRILS